MIIIEFIIYLQLFNWKCLDYHYFIFEISYWLSDLDSSILLTSFFIINYCNNIVSSLFSSYYTFFKDSSV